MSYKIYWKRNVNVGEFSEKFLEEVIKLLIKAETDGIRIQSAYGLDDPKINRDEISINGYYRTNDSNESFRLYATPTREEEDDQENYCDTDHKPYTRVVIQILLLAEKYDLVYDVGTNDDDNKFWKQIDVYSALNDILDEPLYIDDVPPKKELTEEEKRAAIMEKFLDTYYSSFHGQILKREKYDYAVDFNFLNHDLQKFGVFNSYCLDSKKDLKVAVTTVRRDTEYAYKLHVYVERSGIWASAKLEPENWFYQAFSYKGEYYLLCVNDDERSRARAECIVYHLCAHFCERTIAKYSISGNSACRRPGEEMIWSFYSVDCYDENSELLTVQMERDFRQHHYVGIKSSTGKVLAEISCKDSG